MTLSHRLPRSILAVALAFAAAPVLAQDASFTHFDQTVFFGDSITDSGFYQPVLVATAGPGGGDRRALHHQSGPGVGRIPGRFLRHQRDAPPGN